MPTISGRANLRANTHEGGILAATISTGNSGGASGDAYDTISIGAGNTFIFDGTNVKGKLGAKFTSGGTTTGYISWTALGAITTDVWFRTYFAVSAIPTISTWFDMLRPIVSGGGRSGGDVGVRTDGTLRWGSGSSGTEVVAIRSTTVIAPNTIYRLEWRVDPHATLGEIEWWLYDEPGAPIGDHVETKSAGSLVNSGNIDGFRMGNGATAANISGLSAWFDNVAISTDGQIGPGLPEQTRGVGAAVDGGGIGSQWFNVDNAEVEDTLVANSLVQAQDQSRFLKCIDFGFTIPTDATINGIEVRIKKAADAEDVIVDNGVNLLSPGPVGEEGDFATAWPWDVLTNIIYGGPSSLWGDTWTPAEINASTFGVQVGALSTDPLIENQPWIDYVEMTVYYTENGGPPPSTIIPLRSRSVVRR